MPHVLVQETECKNCSKYTFFNTFNDILYLFEYTLIHFGRNKSNELLFYHVSVKILENILI